MIRLGYNLVIRPHRKWTSPEKLTAGAPASFTPGGHWYPYPHYVTAPAPAHPLTDLSVLDVFKAAPFPPGYPASQRTFYAPVDDVHGALVYLINAAQKSLVVAMYSFDDEQLAAALKAKLESVGCFVQLTLDSSQAGGAHERTLLTQEAYPASSIAVGKSEDNAIMHLKEVIIDGVILVTGSTNWSGGAEQKQDNQLTVLNDPYVAAEARARIDAIHANMSKVSTRDGEQPW